MGQFQVIKKMVWILLVSLSINGVINPPDILSLRALLEFLTPVLGLGCVLFVVNTAERILEAGEWGMSEKEKRSWLDWVGDVLVFVTFAAWGAYFMYRLIAHGVV